MSRLDAPTAGRSVKTEPGLFQRVFDSHYLCGTGQISSASCRMTGDKHSHEGARLK